MQAIILATDGTHRLAPLTDGIPAPLLPVIDQPVMAYTVELLARVGCKHLLVSLINHGGSIAAYFGSGKRWGVDITYLTPREDRGTAGALKWATGLLKQTFLVFPGDTLIDLDIEAALEYHRLHGGAATVIMHRRPAANDTHTVRVLADGSVVDADASFIEYAEYGTTGAYIFEPRVLQYIPNGTHFESIADVIPALLAHNERVFGYALTGYWNPFVTLQDYHEAQQVFLQSAYYQRAPAHDHVCSAAQIRFPSLKGRQVAPGIWVGLNDSIHPSAKLAPPVYIGANSWIGRDVELGSGTVIGAGVVIDEEATVSNSTVLTGTYVGRLVHIEDRIVQAATMIDPSSGDCTHIVDPFLLSRINATPRASRRFSRFRDTLIAATLLVGLSPVFAVLWVLVFLASKGRPIVRRPCVGERIEGKDGGETLHIFEHMRFQTRKATGKYIFLGRILERYALHRLPELVNVLRGDMLLVGVKPLTPGEEARLTEDWHQKRHDVPAGFTGLWYTDVAPDSDLDAIVISDVYYAAMHNWRSDWRILGQTPAVWFRRCASVTAHTNNRSEVLTYATHATSESHSETQ